MSNSSANPTVIVLGGRPGAIASCHRLARWSVTFAARQKATHTSSSSFRRRSLPKAASGGGFTGEGKTEGAGLLLAASVKTPLGKPMAS